MIYREETLQDAEEYIRNRVLKKTRCILISKEKYGSLRYEWVFPPGKRRESYNWLCVLWVKWGWRVTLQAAREAAKKWPHLKEEILDDIEWQLNIRP